MACFTVPMTEAIITTAVKKAADKKGGDAAHNPFIEKMNWLNNMLWGGSALLAFEHIWHGEVTPWFPFLTKAVDSADRAEMLHEMATSGVGMALLVTAVWAGMVMASRTIELRSNKKTLKGGKIQ